MQDDENPYDTAMGLYAQGDWQNAIYAFEAELMKNAANEDAKFQLASAIILAKSWRLWIQIMSFPAFT